jgi:hypothetical protein
MTIGGCVFLASLAGFGLARFSIPYKEGSSSWLKAF